MEAVLIVSGLTIVFCGFMLARNEWTFHQAKLWGAAVYRYAARRINAGIPCDSERLYELFDYHYIMWHFWIWDLRTLIGDAEAFDEVMGADALEGEVE